jgi:hypothetical protein
MTTRPWPDLTAALENALGTYDWTTVDALCAEMAAAIRANPAGAVKPAEQALRLLRRKRRFRAVARLADVFFESGAASVFIGRQYVQALIDTGYLTAAERLLDSVATRPDAAADRATLLGLRGRIAKQRHVHAVDPQGVAAHLADAVRYYLEGFELDRSANHWHALNAMALIKRAARKHIPLATAPDADALARHILDTTPVASDMNEVEIWRRANHMEAHLALGNETEAMRCAAAYADAPEVDAFELSSTLRQMIDVWELDSAASLLKPLRAGLLRAEGSEVRLNRNDAWGDLEKVFGTGLFRNLPWYQRGLSCCSSIARIETKLGQAHGTGWLVRAADLQGSGSSELLLVTNAHVVANGGASLRPGQAVARFELQNHVTPVESVVWSSPVNQLDASVLKLASVPPSAEGLALAANTLPEAAGEAPHRLYIIGYPGGRGLEFSLHDNLMLGCNDRRVHYRTATEGGSSGSPVFEQVNWEVVALHHAGKGRMPRLDDPEEVYEANEGIPIDAIRKAICV